MPERPEQYCLDCGTELRHDYDSQGLCGSCIVAQGDQGRSRLVSRAGAGYCTLCNARLTHEDNNRLCPACARAWGDTDLANMRDRGPAVAVLQDAAWYLLPDGTQVQAVEVNGGTRWRLDLDGQPAYYWTDNRWYRMIYDDSIDAYQVAPCDLQIDDLRPAW
jgi:hypothetical protein